MGLCEQFQLVSYDWEGGVAILGCTFNAKGRHSRTSSPTALVASCVSFPGLPWMTTNWEASHRNLLCQFRTSEVHSQELVRSVPSEASKGETIPACFWASGGCWSWHSLPYRCFTPRALPPSSHDFLWCHMSSPLVGRTPVIAFRVQLKSSVIFISIALISYICKDSISKYDRTLWGSMGLWSIWVYSSTHCTSHGPESRRSISLGSRIKVTWSRASAILNWTYLLSERETWATASCWDFEHAHYHSTPRQTHIWWGKWPFHHSWHGKLCLKQMDSVVTSTLNHYGKITYFGIIYTYTFLFKWPWLHHGYFFSQCLIYFDI